MDLDEVEDLLVDGLLDGESVHPHQLIPDLVEEEKKYHSSGSGGAITESACITLLLHLPVL